MEFKKVKTLTLPLVKFSNTPTFVEITSPIYTSEKIKGGTATQQAMEPPKMAQCVNLETGEESVMMFGSVLLGEIEKHYPDNAYVGKSFSIIKRNVPEGKQYYLWQVEEIEVVKEHDPSTKK